MYLLKLTWYEFGLLLKERVGAIWTFIFPVLLLMALVPIYENVGASRSGPKILSVDVCGTEAQTLSFKNALENVYKDELAIVVHGTPGFDASSYRVDLDASCLGDALFASSFEQPTIKRFANDDSQDAFMTHFLAQWLETGKGSDIEVQNMAQPERQMTVAQYLLSGILALTLTSTCLFGVAVSVVSMRMANLFKKYRLFPVTTSEVFGSLLLSRVLLMFTFCIVYMLFGFLYYDFSFARVNVFETALLLLVTVCVLISISLAISNLFSSAGAISPFVSLLYITTILIGNIFFPTKLLPDWVNLISEYYPIRIFVDTFRQAAFGADMGISYWNSILMLLAWGVVCAGLAIKFFRWNAYRRG